MALLFFGGIRCGVVLDRVSWSGDFGWLLNISDARTSSAMVHLFLLERFRGLVHCAHDLESGL